MSKPEAWLYEEYDTNGKLRARHVWNLLPSDLSYISKLKDIGHVEISALDKVGSSVVFDKENKYNSKKLAEVFGGL